MNSPLPPGSPPKGVPDGAAIFPRDRRGKVPGGTVDAGFACLTLWGVKSGADLKPQPGERSDRQVMRIIVYGLSLAFSVLIASTQTVRATATGFQFQFTAGTVFAFLAGAAVVVPCFHAIFYSKRKPLRRFALVVVIAIGFGGFLYPLRFVQGEARPAIFIGLIVAACALSMVAALMFAASRFLSQDEQRF
jgi:peptidoglycan/LPS O-acetylase OafA/YrhL